MISDETIMSKLSKNRWQACAELVDYIRQFGSLGFKDDDEYRRWRGLMDHQQYSLIYRRLQRLRLSQRIDCVIGEYRGCEVRMYRLFP